MSSPPRPGWPSVWKPGSRDPRSRCNDCVPSLRAGIRLTSLGNMLAGLVDARRGIAAQLPAVPLPEEAAVIRARERSLAAAGMAKKELDAARRLVGPG